MRGKRHKGRRTLSELESYEAWATAERRPDPLWDVTCIDLPGRRRVLVDVVTDGCMQARLGGTLKFGPEIDGYEYLSLWTGGGSAATVVVLPHGSTVATTGDDGVTLTVFGVELALGDEVDGGGGGITRGLVSPQPGVDLTSVKPVQALQSLQVGERSLSVLDLGWR